MHLSTSIVPLSTSTSNERPVRTKPGTQSVLLHTHSPPDPVVNAGNGSQSVQAEAQIVLRACIRGASTVMAGLLAITAPQQARSRQLELYCVYEGGS